MSLIMLVAVIYITGVIASAIISGCYIKWENVQCDFTTEWEELFCTWQIWFFTWFAFFCILEMWIDDYKWNKKYDKEHPKV